jgi:hypothetical protein
MMAYINLHNFRYANYKILGAWFLFFWVYFPSIPLRSTYHVHLIVSSFNMSIDYEGSCYVMSGCMSLLQHFYNFPTLLK